MSAAKTLLPLGRTPASRGSAMPEEEAREPEHEAAHRGGAPSDVEPEDAHLPGQACVEAGRRIENVSIKKEPSVFLGKRRDQLEPQRAAAWEGPEGSPDRLSRALRSNDEAARCLVCHVRVSP